MEVLNFSIRMNTVFDGMLRSWSDPIFSQTIFGKREIATKHLSSFVALHSCYITSCL